MGSGAATRGDGSGGAVSGRGLAILRGMRKYTARRPGLDPQNLCLLCGELFLAEDSLVLEGCELLQLFDLGAFCSFGRGRCRLGRWGNLRLAGRSALLLSLIHIS